MRVAGATRHVAADEVAGAQIGKHRHLRVDQRHVEILAEAAPKAMHVAMAQLRQDAQGGVEPREQVAHRNTDLLVPAAGQIVALAGHAQQTAEPLHRVVVAGTLAIRAGLPVAGDRAIDELRVQHCQARVVQPVAGHVADLEVFDQHVGVLSQHSHQCLAFAVRQVDRDRAFVAVRAEEVGRFGAVGAHCIAQQRRAPSAGVVSYAWAFDLDDIGTQVAEHLGAPGPGEHARQIKHAHADER